MSSDPNPEQSESDTNFDLSDLSKIIKKMGGIMGTVATDFSKSIEKVSEVVDKIPSLSNEEIIKIETLYSDLSDKEQDELLELVKGDSEQIKEWWESRCDDPKIISILMNSSKAMGELMHTGNDIKKFLKRTFGEIETSDKISEIDISGLEDIFKHCFSSFKSSGCDTSNGDIRYNLINNVNEMLIQAENIKQNAGIIINTLTPDEKKLIILNKINDNNINNNDNDMDIILNKFEELSDRLTDHLTNIDSKLEDMSLDIELIRNKK